jgi:hypothetical protein
MTVGILVNTYTAFCFIFYFYESKKLLSRSLHRLLQLSISVRTRVFTLSFVPNRVCEGVRLTEKKDCRLPTCWNTIDYYDDAQPSYAANTDSEIQVFQKLF